MQRPKLRLGQWTEMKDVLLDDGVIDQRPSPLEEMTGVQTKSRLEHRAQRRTITNTSFESKLGTIKSILYWSWSTPS